MRLSEFELEVMQLFWVCAQLSAPEAHQEIIKNKDVTYSTVKTIIDRLEKKGAIKRTSQKGRTIFYGAAIQSDDIKQPLISSFIKKVFGGETRPLFNHLVNEEKLSRDDIAYLEELLEKKKKELD
ncbi:BlaI/MecI/CopY family transcriptional regulator [Pleionea mediterranea]|jgi:BlaI family penicillinase repressor|uniref:BlaI family penicillinase repressor n=1 Tax=Pleionea mediterranea TaxID=523701 RepID=A0A316FAL1_9GAMM|nr:BlaI/MecI/CopY family transcriptional regulator [Pleionea mediterranea]PWK45352.1 BlaI family penicillinase repressor [Pleionea mediterranea]